MTIRALPFLVTLAFLIGCQGGADQIMTASEAADVANDVVGEELPQLTLNMLRIETEDLDGKWRVSYHAPEGSTGGPLVVDINKQSGEATVVSMEQ